MSGSVLELPVDHPGVSDSEYVARRNHIARLSTSDPVGTRPPLVALHSGRAPGVVHRALRTDLAPPSNMQWPSIGEPQQSSICRPTRCPNSPRYLIG